MSHALAPHRSSRKLSRAYLRTRGPVVLPAHACARCGRRHSGGKILCDVVQWVHPVVWLTLIISPLLTLFTYLVARKRTNVQYYLCPECADRRRIRRITTALIALISLGGLGASITLGEWAFTTFLASLGISVAIPLLFGRAPVKASGFKDGHFLLNVPRPVLQLDDHDSAPSRVGCSEPQAR